MTAQEYFEKAETLYESERYEESLDYLEKALELEPENFTFLVLNGKVLRENDQLDETIEVYLKAIEINSEDANAYYNLGNTYHEKELLDQAIEYYLKAIEINSEDADAYYNLGAAYYEKELLDQAIEYSLKAIEINSEDADAYYNLGNTYHEKELLDQAIEYYLKAIAINLEHDSAYYNLGIAYKDKGLLDEAIEAYQKAIAINLEHASAYYNLGIVYKDKGQQDEAIEAYQKAIAINPKHGSACYNLGITYYEIELLDEAIEAYQKAIAINPKHGTAYFNLGVAYKGKELLDEAIEAYQKAIVINSEHGTAYYNLGNAYYEKGQQDEAIEAYQKAIVINPKYASAYNNLGIAYYDKGLLDEAKEAYQKAIVINPEHSSAYYNLGRVHEKKNEWLQSFREQSAQRCYFKALTLQIRPIYLKSYLNIWYSYQKHFFFLQDLFARLLSSNRELFIQEQVASKCRHINLSLSYYKSLGVNLKMNSLEWAQFIAMINYFMGHPQKAFHIFRDEILSKPPTNLQAHYYLIQSCYDFLEDEKSYLEQALSIAEQIRKTLPKTRRKGILGMGRTKVIIPSKAEVLQRYYAALLFKDNDDIDSALECIAPIWDKTDYLPLVYLYYGLLYEQAEEQQESILSEINDGYNGQTTLRILIKAPFPKIGHRILELETSNDREKHFAYGFPLHAIDPDREKWWEPFYHYAHYREIASYISLWKLQVEHHFNKRKLGIVAGDSLKEFWDCFTIEDIDIIKMQEQIQKYSREKVGLLFLEGAKRYLKEISSQINTDPAQLQGAVEYVLFESGKTKEQSKRAYEELQKMPGKTDNALVYRIASKIEANELGDDLATYYYLNSYFFLSKNLSEKDYIMLNMYATYAQAYQNQGVSKILQGGLKDQFKDMFGTAYDIATVAAANPVLSLTLGALKPLAKGSMGELFIGMIKDIKFTTMMRYADTTYAEPPYEKQVAAPSFQEAFLEFVGKEKERLGGRFEDVYPMYGFEEWIEA